MRRSSLEKWSASSVGLWGADLAWDAWICFARLEQYPVEFGAPDRWLVTGGRGSGKTRLGAEWVNALVRGLPPFAEPKRRYEHFALVGETLGDVREVMIEGPSGLLAVCTGSRPRYEASRRRVLWPTGAVAHVFSSEDPESLRGPQFAAAWCDEVGCPATDKGSNQPNVFSDPKSTEGALPWFSSGGRSDLAQQRHLLAHHRHWDPAGEDFHPLDNPLSPLTGKRMVDPGRLYVWAWDARPYPAFPLRGDRWSDNGNWHYGHWLNGRLGNPTVGELVNAILADHGLPQAEVEGADGTVHGYVIDEPGSARSAMEPLADLFGLAVTETPEGLVFRSQAAANTVPAVLTELVSDGREPVKETVRTPDHDLPTEALLSFRDPLVDYQAISVRQAWRGVPGRRQHAIGFPGTLDRGQGSALVGDWLRRAWTERETVSFAVPQPDPDVVPGALVRLPGSSDEHLVTGIEDGMARRVSARRIVRAAPMPWHSKNPGAASTVEPVVGRPLALFLDLPMGAGPGAAEAQFRVAAWQKPWRSQIVLASPEDTGFTQRATIGRAADLGTLVEALAPGVVGRLDRSRGLLVSLRGADLASVTRAQLMNGANVAAVRSAEGWEIVQFETADEIAPDVWRLDGLLRGQLGTEDAMTAGAATGSHFVMLDEAVPAAGLAAGEIGLLLNWRVAPLGSDLSGDTVSEYSGAGGLRALTPLAPVHLRARGAAGDIALSWVRRGRLDADSWTSADIPLGEEREEYQVQIAHPGGAVVRTATSASQSFLYGAAAIADDFGAMPDAIDVTVRQLSLAAGWGLPATRSLSLA